MWKKVWRIFYFYFCIQYYGYFLEIWPKEQTIEIWPNAQTIEIWPNEQTIEIEPRTNNRDLTKKQTIEIWPKEQTIDGPAMEIAL